MHAARAARRPATFRRGSQVWIDFFDAAGIPQSLPALLEEVGADGLTLRPPRHVEGVLRLAPGTELTVWTGRDPRGLVAMVRLLSLQPGNPPILLTTVPDPVRTMTVRRLYRVDTDLPVEGAPWPGGARLVNVSGSGGLVVVPRPRRVLPLDRTAPALWSVVPLHVDLGAGEEPLHLHAKVVRMAAGPDGTRFGLSFVDLGRRHREQLVRYVLQRLREIGPSDDDSPAER